MPRRPLVTVAFVIVLAALGRRAEAQEVFLGSDPEERVEAYLGLWYPSLKRTSDVSHRGRGNEPRLGEDLGFPARPFVGEVGATVRFGLGGFVSAELMGFVADELTGVISQDGRQFVGDTFQKNDVVSTDARFLWGRLQYGWEARVRFTPFEGFPIDVYLAPIVSLGVWHVDAKIDRVFPSPTEGRRGGTTAAVIVPGLRAGFELARVFRAGVDFEWLPDNQNGKYKVTSPHLIEWERLRLFVGLRWEMLEVTVGYRYLNASAKGRDSGPDIKLRGPDMTFGVRF